MNINDQVFQNLIFFNENILPFYYIVPTSLGSFIIEPDIRDFCHLNGFQHSINPYYRTTSSERIYERLMKILPSYLKNEDFDLAIIVNDEEDIDEHEKYILDRVNHFTDLFLTFENTNNIYIYRNVDPNSTIKADYVHFVSENFLGKNLLIRGKTENDCFLFVSIEILRRDKEKYLGRKILLTGPIEKVNKDVFVKSDIQNLLVSQRQIVNISFTDKDKEEKVIILPEKLKLNIYDLGKLLKKTYSDVNYRIEVGRRKKNSIQIIQIQNNHEIIPHLEYDLIKHFGEENLFKMLKQKNVDEIICFIKDEILINKK